MKRKRYIVGAAVTLALLINQPQVMAEDVETFGGEFEERGVEFVPFQDDNQNSPYVEEDDMGEVLTFNNPPETEEIIVEPTPRPTERKNILPPSKNPSYTRDGKTNKTLHTKSQRFVKVAMDDTYIYYLDKQSIAWKRLPYSASEYMLDFWVRMVEINPDNSDLPEDYADYIEHGVNGEVEVAAGRGITFTPSDIEVLNHRKFFLEHYYIRPKTKQIQFLCELEVVGHPQNTVSEREYNYKNWENLIPGSIESMIYNVTMKEVHKSRADAKGHMGLADFFDEYLRVPIR